MYHLFKISKIESDGSFFNICLKSTILTILFIYFKISFISLHPVLVLPAGCPLSHARSFFAAAKSVQSCPTLCNPIDGSPPGSPVPGILQARTLEWAAISFSNEDHSLQRVNSLSSQAQKLRQELTCSKSTPGFLPGKSQGHRCPVGYSPRCCKELHMTE